MFLDRDEGGWGVTIEGQIPEPFASDLRFRGDVEQAVKDTLENRIPGLDAGAFLGEVVFQDDGWRFDRDERFDQADPFDPPERGQIGFGRITEETGTVERFEEPGDELVEEALSDYDTQAGEGVVRPPERVGEWVMVDDPVGNYSLYSWQAEDRPLFVRVQAPIGRHGTDWGVELDDSRITGVGSSVPIHARSPDAETRVYDNEGVAVARAIRWMARHDAATANHPFMDDRVLNPPTGWELEMWSLERRKERLRWGLAPNAIIDLPISSIEVVGFHGGDSYEIRATRALDQIDPEGFYPDRGESVPRDRVLDAVTRFMERHTPTIEELDESEFEGQGELSEQDKTRIQHHALNDDLNTILSVLGLRGPQTRRNITASIQDVDEFIAWYEQRGHFEDLEGIGPSRSDTLVEAARIAKEAREDLADIEVPELAAGDVIRSDAGNTLLVESVRDNIRVRDEDNPDNVTFLGQREWEIGFRTGGFELVDRD